MFETFSEIRRAQGHERGPGVHLLPSSAFFATHTINGRGPLNPAVCLGYDPPDLLCSKEGPSRRTRGSTAKAFASLRTVLTIGKAAGGLAAKEAWRGGVGTAPLLIHAYGGPTAAGSPGLLFWSPARPVRRRVGRRLSMKQLASLGWPPHLMNRIS